MDGYLNPKNINYDTSVQESVYLYPRKHDVGQRGVGLPTPYPRQQKYINTQEVRDERKARELEEDEKEKVVEKNKQDGMEGYLNPTLTEYNTSLHLSSSPLDIHPSGTKTRFDSGVGDLEIHGLSISTSPRRSTAYEYVDNDNHYEEVPTLQRGRQPAHFPLRTDTGQSSPVIGQRSPAVRQRSTQLSGVTEVASDTEDGGTVTFRTSSSSSSRRKITNPLYSRLISVASSIFSDSHSVKKVDTLEKQIQCQCVVILILFIVTLGSTALIIYLMIGQSESFINNNQLLIRVQQLEEQNKKFFHSSLMETNKTVYNLNQIYVNEKEIKLKYENLSLMLSSFSENIEKQFDNITKMPGPPGVGNLSSCFYKNHTTSSQGSDMTTSSTRWLPDLADLSKYVVMSAVCSVTGGTRQNLKTMPHSKHWVQYQCECTGAIPGEVLRQCFIHLVLCPRLS